MSCTRITFDCKHPIPNIVPKPLPSRCGFFWPWVALNILAQPDERLGPQALKNIGYSSDNPAIGAFAQY